MPMKGMFVPDQRLLFVRSVLEDGLSISAACRFFEISRPTGYAILRRYNESGIAGLVDLSRVPHGNSRAVPTEIAKAITDLKASHTTWGPKKLRAKLVAVDSDTIWPVTSTFGRILSSAGLVVPRRRTPSKSPRLGDLTQAEQINEVWCVDFKGQFFLACGILCYPLTVTDNYSRYLLRCHGLSATSYDGTCPIMVGAFREFGMPFVIRSDNGPPFASASTTGLSRLAVWLIKLGIIPERTDPGSPQQNGRHERMHRTLKAEAIGPPCHSMRAQQSVFDAWRSEYNDERPHEALDMKTPASMYCASNRRFPEQLPNFEYEDSILKRQVRPNGCIKWCGHEIFVSETLTGDTIGIVPVDEYHHLIYAGFLAVAVLDIRAQKLLKSKMAAPYLRDARASLRGWSQGPAEGQ